MLKTCDYCRAPITASYLGRPWPDRPAATYCCYGCLSLGESDRPARLTETKLAFRLDGFALRIGIGLLVAGQSMIFGLAINLEEQTPSAVKLAVQIAILTGTLLVIGLLGPPLLHNAVSEIRRGRLTIEALFLLTMAGAMFASLQSLASGRGPIYFEVVTVLLVVYSLGKAIGARSRAGAIAATRIWASSLRTCRLVDGKGLERSIEVTSILPGDVVETRPGEMIAIDGVIREGVGFISEAPVSGEPFAVVRRPGDRVLAGMASHDAAFYIEATAPGSARQLDRLLDVVERARNRPTSLQAQADRLARIVFPLIVGVAILTFAIWTHRSGWPTGLFNAMSVLLVACPCALGLATPIVIWSALNRLAERGLVAHAGDVIERLSQIDRVVFDKTGTLTEDRFVLSDLVTFADGDERARILGWLSLVEERSNHPVARPFAGLPRPFSPDRIPRVVSLRVVPGCGIEAVIEDRLPRPLPEAGRGGNLFSPPRFGEGPGEGFHRLRIGRPEWINTIASVDESILKEKLLAPNGHRIDFEIDGRLAAIAVLAERLRESVPETLGVLSDMGLSVDVLTGDAPERAGALSLPEARGNLFPEDKRQIILKMKQSGGKPLMIGDGINDASALAAAHVGIALATGTDLANSAAAATLYHGDLRVLPWAIALSRDAVGTVRRSLFLAAGYNVVGITLAAFGVLHPLAAALLMVVSSLFVAWSSVRVGASAKMGGCHVHRRLRLRGQSAKPQAAIHALAIIVQSIVALFLLQPSVEISIATVFLFAFVAVSTAFLWQRWSGIPHWIDMAFGMFTFGNLGMLAGWWADNGFTGLRDIGCRECARLMRDGILKPWMWIGMIVFAKVAMAFLTRRPHPEIRGCKTLTFTGGNLGMLIGMFFGGWLAGHVETDSVPLGAFASYVGMTIGMIGGMLIGNEIARRLVDLLPRFGRYSCRVLSKKEFPRKKASGRNKFPRQPAA